MAALLVCARVGREVRRDEESALGCGGDGGVLHDCGCCALCRYSALPAGRSGIYAFAACAGAGEWGYGDRRRGGCDASGDTTRCGMGAGAAAGRGVSCECVDGAPPGTICGNPAVGTVAKATVAGTADLVGVAIYEG